MNKQTQQYELVEDVTLEELLREDLEENSGKDEDSQVEESKDEEEVHPKAGEAKEEDSQVDEKKETDEDEEEVTEKKETEESEDEEVSEKKETDSDDSQVSEKKDSEESDEDEEESKKEESYDFSEDVKALEAAGEGLSEDYKSKAATIFEAAVTSKIASEKKKLEESFKKKLHDDVNKVAATITEKVDSYLNYVVSNWMEENKVAVEAGLRTELAEGFISALKNVFTENYVEVPASKRDLYAELEGKVAKIEESAKASQDALTEANKKLQEYQRKAIIAEASKGLAATQVDRLASLTNDVEFMSEEAFTAKVKTIKESYFKSSSSSVKTGVSTSVLKEGNQSPKADASVSPEVKAVTDMLSRFSKKAAQS